MSKFKISFVASLALITFAFAAALAEQGTGTSEGQVFNDQGVALTSGTHTCDVHCERQFQNNHKITSQIATFNNGVSLELEAGAEGSIILTPDGGGQFAVEVTLPSNIFINGAEYVREGDLVFDGHIASWPQSSSDYVLRDRVNFTNGGETVHIEAGVILSLAID